MIYDSASVEFQLTSCLVAKPILEIRTSEKGSEDIKCLQINMYSFLHIKKEPSEMLSSFFN